MKKVYLSALTILASVSSWAVTHVVTNTGNTFSPASIQVNLGDTVLFQVSNTHNVVEVSSANWAINDGTPLAGGFSLPSGGGIYVPDAVGDVYYVCQPHVAMGMKGIIKVAPAAVGIENQGTVAFELFPNPAVDELSIMTSAQSTGQLSYRLINLSGQQVAAKSGIAIGSGSAVTTIGVADLPRGVYMLQLSYNGKAITRRVILK